MNSMKEKQTNLGILLPVFVFVMATAYFVVSALNKRQLTWCAISFQKIDRLSKNREEEEEEEEENEQH